MTKRPGRTSPRRCSGGARPGRIPSSGGPQAYSRCPCQTPPFMGPRLSPQPTLARRLLPVLWSLRTYTEHCNPPETAALRLSVGTVQQRDFGLLVVRTCPSSPLGVGRPVPGQRTRSRCEYSKALEGGPGAPAFGAGTTGTQTGLHAPRQEAVVPMACSVHSSRNPDGFVESTAGYHASGGHWEGPFSMCGRY